MNKTTTELVFISWPGVGHLVPTVEFAKLLVGRDERLSITVLAMKFPFSFSDGGSSSAAQAEAEAHPRIRFVQLPNSNDFLSGSPSLSHADFVARFIDTQKPRVRDAVAVIILSDRSKLAGLVIDFMCTGMIDIANEFQVPTYLYFTSSAAFLGLLLHLQELRDDHHEDVIKYMESEMNLSIPCFVNPVPAKLLPYWIPGFLNVAKRFRETKGIIMSTFFEMETQALKALSNGNNIPPIYPVGPVLNHTHRDRKDDDDDDDGDMILRWLDNQPASSVVFLCFGSMGSFDGPQVKEIARALEISGCNFLWSLRQPPRKGKMGFPSEYKSFEDVLPEGFVERTAGVGKVVGWAPQLSVLLHPAVGGFVSHCGWNSILEAVWCGVPMAAWPLFADQQLNAFQVVRELGISVEIKMDYRNDVGEEKSIAMVGAEQIEVGIKMLKEEDGEVGKRVKEMREKSRMAMAEGGSSQSALHRLIDDIIIKFA